MVRLAPRIKIITLLYSLRFLTSNYCRFQKFRPSTPNSYFLPPNFLFSLCFAAVVR